MSAAGADLNARQRKHVHMHSSIFNPEGPTTKSVYVASRQQELYNELRGTLREYNQKPPEINMPKAGDVKCTQNAGHGAVWATSPRGGAGQETDQVLKTPRAMRTTGPEYVVYDGEAQAVVKSSGQDSAAIPKEFWQTSVNLQWHDTRNENCRQKGNATQGMSAGEVKRHQMSSEIFGKERMLNSSTATPSKDLMAETQDHLKLDSRLQGRPAASPDVKERAQHNLNKSSHNTMPASEVAQRNMASEDNHNEDPAGTARRRGEKNFSDMFGCKMGDRKETRGQREEILGSRNCSFLDPRTEIASRNKGHWKSDEVASAADRKQVEGSSQLFDRSSPRKPVQDPEAAEVSRNERACWESKDGMATTNEIARRRRQKGFQGDFDDSQGHTHHDRQQLSMASNGVGNMFGGTPAAAWGQSPRGQQCLSPRAGPAARAPMMSSHRSAQDTKLASLQSSIFS
mmetsp:Transcript_39063/g.112148  ORF Transcript_39063/g.112148 Transcript_39063/m.112148 type:complete len:457 (-) Transcript_39063:261-1631(-)